jgi:hypothetical protein
MSEKAEFLYETTDYWHAASEQYIKGNEPALNPKDAAGLG